MIRTELFDPYSGWSVYCVQEVVFSCYRVLVCQWLTSAVEPRMSYTENVYWSLAKENQVVFKPSQIVPQILDHKWSYIKASTVMEFIYWFIILQTRKQLPICGFLGSQTAISSDLGYHSNAAPLKHHRQLPSLSQWEKTVCLSTNDSAAIIDNTKQQIKISDTD